MRRKENNSFARSELVDTAVYNNLKTELYHSFSDEDISVLKHHGILGMKWGVRRYQNEDGSLTPEGQRRYSSTLIPGGWRPPMWGETVGERYDDGSYVVYKKRSKKELEDYDRKQNETKPTSDPNRQQSNKEWSQTIANSYETLHNDEKLQNMISDYWSGEEEYSGEKYFEKMCKQAEKTMKSINPDLSEDDIKFLAFNYVEDRTW